MNVVAPLAAGRWVAESEAILADGYRFRTLYAAQGSLVRAVFTAPGRATRLISIEADGVVPSLVELIPAAGWAEREAHDIDGVRFSGHDPLRPLVDHPAALPLWTTPVTGPGVHEVAVGPIHAGIIESGHYRFHVVGERILLLDLRLFYKHRGLERAAVGSTLNEGLAYAARACAACSVANSVAYAPAAEQLLGLAPAAEMSRARTALLELERLYNHLHDLSAICAGIGFAAGAMVFAGLKERAQRLNATLCGHRFLFATVAVGRSDVAFDGEAGRRAAAEVVDLGEVATATWRQLLFSSSVQDRFAGAGVLRHEDAVRLGALGPAARASGISADTRTESVGLAYDGFASAVPAAPVGDVAARAEVRHLELRATCGILEELLTAGLQPVRAAGRGALPPPVGVGRVEGPRGESICCLEAGSSISRLHLRTASYANWPAVAQAVAGNILPEFPLINKSFELCYACVDR